MRRNFRRKRLRAACGEKQSAALCVLGAQKGEEIGAVWQGGGVDLHALGKLCLERADALQRPEGQYEKIERIPLQQQNDRFPEQICRNQRAVQIDRKRNEMSIYPMIHVYPSFCPERQTIAESGKSWVNEGS